MAQLRTKRFVAFCLAAGFLILHVVLFVAVAEPEPWWATGFRGNILSGFIGSLLFFAIGLMIDWSVAIAELTAERAAEDRKRESENMLNALRDQARLLERQSMELEEQRAQLRILFEELAHLRRREE